MITRKNIKTNEAPIGIFDSGVGGLSVLKAIQQLMPNENLIYLADTKYTPYGERSTDFINQRVAVSFIITSLLSLSQTAYGRAPLLLLLAIITFASRLVNRILLCLSGLLIVINIVVVFFPV